MPTISGNESLLENRYIIHILGTGERIEIGDDSDGLELTEIVFYTDDGSRESTLIITDEQLILLIKALQKRALDLGKVSLELENSENKE